MDDGKSVFESFGDECSRVYGLYLDLVTGQMRFVG